MKKLLTALLLSSFALSAQAGSFYVQGDVGATNLKFDEEDGGKRDTSMHQRLSLGYKFNENWRLAVDYTNYGKFEMSEDLGYYGTVSYSAKISSLGLSGFYDFSTVSNFKPYVGLRISSNKVKETGSASGYFSNLSYSETDRYTGAALLGGIQYKLTEQVKLNAGLEFGRIGGNTTAISGNLGLRYDF